MHDFGFDRSFRLLRRPEYDRVFHRPVRAGTAALLVLASRNGLGTARLGLIVPKKALRRAVQRNRVKRIIRESFRHARPELPEMDVIVIARSQCGSLSNRELSRTLVRLWHQISSRLPNQQS